MSDLLESLAKSRALKRVAPKIAAELLPCARLVTERAKPGSIGIAVSRLGGLPDLPSAAEWPCRNGTPLSFIAQINVSALPKFEGLADLPASTLLSFFYDTKDAPWGYDPDDRGSCRVLASPISSVTHFERRPRPETLPEEGIFWPCALTIKVATCLPDPFSRIVEKLNLTQDERYAYLDLFYEFAPDETPGLHHQLLGHADQIQNDMQLECQLVTNGINCGGPEGYADPRRESLEEGAAAWRLLLQIDTDENTDMEWGDSGRLYYWINNKSLRAQAFEDTWLILQCG
jgi:uncharacterized protein YwqG